MLMIRMRTNATNLITIALVSRKGATKQRSKNGRLVHCIVFARNEPYGQFIRVHPYDYWPTINTALQNISLPFSQKLLNNTSSAK